VERRIEAILPYAVVALLALVLVIVIALAVYPTTAEALAPLTK
jgi:hypothetical protein